MTNTKTKKLVIASLFVAIAVVGSMFSFPVFGSRCSPVQHLINVLSAVLLGPWYGVVMAFVTSVLRNLLGLGTLLAFPGSMCGALLAGLLYKFRSNIYVACGGELFGTSVIGGMIAYPVAAFILGNDAAALFTFVVPFFVSSAGGTIIAAVILVALKSRGVLRKFSADVQ